MLSAKKITTYFFVAIVSASLLAGYFCFAPQMAQAASNMSYMSDSSSGCQAVMVEFNGPIIASSASPNSIAPCCLAKKDNFQPGTINLNIFSSENTYSQLVSESQIVSDISSSLVISFDYPISPTQTGISSSIALIE